MVVAVSRMFHVGALSTLPASLLLVLFVQKEVTYSRALVYLSLGTM